VVLLAVLCIASVGSAATLFVDQTIPVGQASFAAVEVRFTGALGGTEIIDNVLVTTIPEPTAALLFGMDARVLRAAVGPGR
jgi:hypothetical protein